MSHSLIEKQVIYTGRKVRLEIHHLEDNDGKRIQREVCVHPGAVVILPFLNQKTILLIRSYRYAISQILLELPAGTLEKGESPINCAGRELQEETGYLAERLNAIASFFTSPGILSEKMYAFAAYDLRQTHQALEEGEDIQVEPVDFDEALAMIRTGEIADGKTIAALLTFDRFMRGR
jgi:ADP-ribose pyrophosphatase